MSSSDLAARRRAAVKAWQVAGMPDAVVTHGTAKEMRLEADRRLQARRRQAEIVEARTARARARPAHARTPPGLRAVVVHPHPHQRRNLVRALDADGRFQVVGEAEDGAAGVGLCVVEQPDVVLLGQQMTYMTGFEAAPEIRRYAPQTIVALQVAGSEYLGTASLAGAHAAFPPGLPLSRLVHELIEVATAGSGAAAANAG